MHGASFTPTVYAAKPSAQCAACGSGVHGSLTATTKSSRAMGDESNIHTLYNLAISALGLALGIIGFFIVRLIKQLDHKADKSEIRDLKDDIRDLISKVDNIANTQAQRHDANTARLDNILLKINGLNGK